MQNRDSIGPKVFGGGGWGVGEGRRGLSPRRSSSFPYSHSLKSLSLMQAQPNCLLPARLSLWRDNTNEKAGCRGRMSVLGRVGPYARPGPACARFLIRPKRTAIREHPVRDPGIPFSEHIIDRTRFLLGETDEAVKPSAKSWCAWRRQNTTDIGVPTIRRTALGSWT